MGECGHGQDRRGEHRERRDQARASRVERERAVDNAACEERDAEHEHAVRDHRPHERGLHDSDEPRVQREQRDEQLRQVAERRLHGAGGGRPHACAELLGRAADEPRQLRDRQRGERERQHGRRVREVGDGGGGDERRCDAELNPVGPVHAGTATAARARATLTSLVSVSMS
jgi:hypothetical protein